MVDNAQHNKYRFLVVDSRDTLTPIILAGGKGTRLHSVLPDIPKPMAPVNGRPFIFYLLDLLIFSKFKSVVLSVGYKSSIIQKEIGDRYKSLAVNYVEEDQPLGTAGAIKHVFDTGRNTPFLVLNGDSFCDIRMDEFLCAIPNSATAAIVVTKVIDSARYGAVEVNESGFVKDFEEKKEPINSALVNAGIYWFSMQAVEQIPSNQTISLEYDVLPALIESGLYAWNCESRFIDIGTPTALKNSGRFFSSVRQKI